jgi:polyisoprenyl-teichoic acid--peptidoglycan teichoic acid transferase
MNIRKFYLMISSALLVILFVSGIVLLNQLNYLKSAGFSTSASNDSDIFAPFVNNQPMNILLLGGDYVNNNTDTMMILNYNPLESKISILSIPRDTKVQIKGKTRKINYAYPNGGIDEVNATIKDLLGIDINYYIYLDTSVFRKIIDILGGVNYYIPIDMNYDDDVQNLHIHLKKGQQLLDGAQAEQFMRFRHPSSWKKSPGMLKFYTGSDLNRIDAQQDFIKEVVKQKTNIMYLPKFKDVVTTLFEEVKTNFAMNNAIRLIQKITELSSTDITYFKIGGEDKYIGSLSYYVYNEKIEDNSTKEVTDATTIINKYFVSTNGFDGNVNTNTDSKINKDIQTESTKASTPKKAKTKKNPSNSEGTIKKPRKAGP